MTPTAKFLSIGEMLHASIKKPGEAMRALLEAGTDDASGQPGEALALVTELIASQARDGADYIDVNIDALGGDGPALMRQYVRLVHENGAGVPASIDSSNIDVLLAGMDEWFARGANCRPPLVNSIPDHQMDAYAPVIGRRAQNPFAAIFLLCGPEGTLKSPEAVHESARKVFAKAREAGFEATDILFDTVTLGLAADGCISAMGEIKPTHIHVGFHGMRRVKADPDLAGVRCVQGVSNYAYGAKKRRIGHIRAYVEVGREYGLDGAIVDVAKQFGVTPADAGLMELVRGLLALDGAEDSMMAYSALMTDARAKEWI